MRTPLQLIRSAFAAPDLEAQRATEGDFGSFESYTTRLTGHRYRGIPSAWMFAVLGASNRPGRAVQPSVIETAQEIVHRTKPNQSTPLVFLSDDPNVRLEPSLRFDRADVFCIDSEHLPSVREQPTTLRLAPVIRAVRRQLTERQLASFIFAPYNPLEPAREWRFFGRRQELDALVNSSGNYFVVGARMTGKTSLLKEAERLLLEQGHNVYYVPLQFISEAHQVVEEILKSLSEREAVTAKRRGKLLDESLLLSVVKTISRRHGRVVLILDEIGNVLNRPGRGTDWSVIGTLRQFSQSGNLRVLMSGYQEFLQKQAQDFSGPFVNFANIIRLQGFSNAEIEDFLTSPLGVWGHVGDSRTLLHTAINDVGRHPLFLQYFGRHLFERVMSDGRESVDQVARELVAGPGLEVFEQAVNELFFRTASPVERYLYIQRCVEADTAGDRITDVELDDAWTRRTLEELGWGSTYDGRRDLLEGFELKGLALSVGGNRSRQRIAAPVIFRYLKHTQHDLRQLTSALASDITSENSPCPLTPRPGRHTQ